MNANNNVLATATDHRSATIGTTLEQKAKWAKAILERRNRMTHVIIPGEINAVIGSDGVAEALKERWLVPDTDSGFLCATNDLAKVEEMRKLAEMPPDQYKPEPICVSGSHDVSLQHTRRERRIHEVAAPATGAPAPGLSSIAQPNPPPPPPNSAPPPAAPPPAPIAGAPQGYSVGTPVTVARQGVTAQGMIEKLMPDGRYSIGYPATVTNRPPGDNIFSREEMTVAQNDPSKGPPTR